jgi:hypothetical protein
MALTFASLAIPGASGAVKPGDWSTQSVETQYMGVEGVSLITGERGGRDLMCNVWLFNSYTLSTLNTAFRTLQAKILKSGTLVDGLGVTWSDCVLLAVTVRAGPVNSPPVGWMYDLDLKWRQLRP